LPAVLAVALAVRLAFVIWMPAAAHSADAEAWEDVARVLDAGVNPYAATSFLNWPPLWLLCIAAMSGLSHTLGVPFFRVLQATLILIELGALALAWALLRRPSSSGRRAVGCSSGWPSIRWRSCSPGARSLGLRRWVLGMALVLGPAAFGLGILYALSPEAIARNVFAYRSLPGFYGFTGLLDLGEFLEAEQRRRSICGPAPGWNRPRRRCGIGPGRPCCGFRSSWLRSCSWPAWP